MIRTITVVGGGTAGLLSALTLKRQLPGVTVCVVHSRDIGIIGVGEGTTPIFPSHLLETLKLDPRHKGAHEYIGEAYLMDKKPAEAEKHLAELEKICGNKSCEEYADLAKAIADYKSRN